MAAFIYASVFTGTACAGTSWPTAVSTTPGAFARRCCLASWRAFRAASFCFFAW